MWESSTASTKLKMSRRPIIIKYTSALPISRGRYSLKQWMDYLSNKYTNNKYDVSTTGKIKKKYDKFQLTKYKMTLDSQL